MNLLFNKQFINESMTDLIPGKIHTIRTNYDYWKRHDGKEVSIRTWSGKPYRSKQIEVCKKIIRVQKILFEHDMYTIGPYNNHFFIKDYFGKLEMIYTKYLAKNDGFEDGDELLEWFANCSDGEMAILHFTDFRY